jgi:hypothetical protein
MRRDWWSVLFVVSFVGVILFYDYVEGWSTLDSILFVCITITTIGYGQIVPSSDLSRLFTIGCMFVGILLIFSTIKHVFHILAQTIKRRLLPGLNLQHYVYSLAGVSLGLFLFVLMVGTVFMQVNEQITFVNALYFVVSTATVRSTHTTTHTHIYIYIYTHTYIYIHIESEVSDLRSAVCGMRYA